MRVAWALAGSTIRGRRGALAGLCVVIALGTGVSLASFEAAQRTERAYPTYLERADVGDLVVNPSLSTARAEETIRTTPGVAAYTSDDLLVATLDDGAPRRQGVVDSPQVYLRMSDNGRYTTQDRPVVHEGRMVRSGREAFVNREAADFFGLQVGDEVPLSFWAPSFTFSPNGPDDIVEPVGHSEVRVVGIGVFADDVVVDELYHRRRMVVPPEVAEPFTCTFEEPRAGDPRALDEVLAEVVPPTCALAYRYFSLHLEEGDAGVGRVTEELLARFTAENHRLPGSMRADNTGYTVIPIATRGAREQLDRSLQPVVTALRAFALAVGSSTVVVALLGAMRVARRDEDDARTWRHLGVLRLQRLAAMALPLGGVLVVGLVGAVAVGWSASGIGPVASARALEPDAPPALSSESVAVVVGAALAALVVGIAAVAALASRGVAARPSVRGTRIARAAGLSSSPARALGIRAALASGRAGAVLAGAVAAVGVVLATVVFSTSLGGLLDQPVRYGWPYDAAVVVGYGYGGLDHETVEATLDRPEVEGWGVASLGSVFIEGESVPAVGAGADFDELALPLIEGDLPVATDEVALGLQTSQELDLAIGDEIIVTSDFGEAPARVTGLVVLPSLGVFESDRAGTGTGVLLSAPLFDELIRQGEDAFGLEPGELRSQLDAFVGMDLQDGVDPERFLAGVDEELRSWDGYGFVPFPQPDPVRPPQIADAAAMQTVPVALGGFFALAMAIGLALGIAAATRERRRELALLRALGCSGGQVAASVRWHALSVVAVALLIGLPVGVAIGRTLYGAFADDLGVVPVPVVSLRWTLLVLVATVAVGLLAAVLPARRSGRERAAMVLRNE